MIEDQVCFSDLIITVLEGLDIEAVESLKEAKEKLDIQRYDMLLIDLNLPDSQGLDTLRRLSHYKIPKVVLTGQFDLSEEASSMCEDYLIKSDISTIYERIMFNVAKIRKAKRPRFSNETFEQIKACFEGSRYLGVELTAV